jgi:hypothetical protein
MADNNDIDQATLSAVNSIMKSVNAGKTVSDAQLRAFLNAVGKATDGMKDVDFTARNVAKSFKSTASGMRGFAGQLSSGNTAFTVVNTAIRGVSDGLGSLAKMIPIIGDGVAGLVGQVGKAAEFSVEQIEAGYGAFNQLSDTGLIGSKGIKGLAEDFAEAGIPLKTYTALLSNSSKKLAALSGTAHEASSVFASTMGELKKDTRKGINGVDNQLRLLGYSTEEIGETFLNYADLQRRLGREQSFNSQTLKDGTVAYAKELDLIAKITGMSRKEQQKLVEQAMAESRWRATVMGAGEKQKLQMDTLNNGLSAFSGELAQGMRDQATGFTQSDAAQRLFRSTGGASAKIMQQLNAEQITGHQALIMFQDAIKGNMDPMTALAKATGNQAGVYTDYSKNVDFANASIKELGKATQTQANQTKDPDKVTQGAVGAVVALEDASTKISAMFMDSDNAATALRGFADATNMAAEAAYNLFLTGDKSKQVKLTRPATASEANLQTNKSKLGKLNEEYNSLTIPGFMGMRDPKDNASKARVVVLATEISNLEKTIGTLVNKVETETAGSLTSGKELFSQYGLGDDYWKKYNKDGRRSDHEFGYDPRRQAMRFANNYGTEKIQPHVVTELKKLLDSSGRIGEGLMSTSPANKQLWKEISQLLHDARNTQIDYDKTQHGVQDTAPETQEIIKNQTDALNNMGAKLDKIAYNTNKLVTKTEQLVSNLV